MITAAPLIAVDLGQGATRSRWRTAGTRTGAAVPDRVAGVGGFWAGAPVDTVAAAVGAVARPGDGPVRIGVGMTGLHGGPAPIHDLGRGLAGLGFSGTVAAADDAVTGYLGAVGDRPGVAVIAGTGVVVTAVGADGQVARVDGWGHALGDRGSGYWIGRAAIRAGVEQLDRGIGGPLADAVLERWGPADELARRWRTAAPGPAEVAAFAEAAATVAVAGDPDARQVWTRAGRLLAESALMALERTHDPARPVTVALTGGLAAAAALLEPSFRERIGAAASGARVVVAPPNAPLDGAALIAAGELELPGLEELVARTHIEGELVQ
ncbi:BadF/BadG/BcrA/BcrD ATPase family protein [Jiangella gansuensis]|uniref:BadF/BadG/BcrA/BcrD ATPase family protein n=1 Tax=Jiangella gansuensis TaxID=281473 RepID=UPI0004BCC888|nr:BadF/BadG/BcrA/BcrD ATPase family protein [Jiangella gansuensis]